MKKYQINAICDPYNAQRHYHGQRVVRYNCATPVEWVMEEGITLEEAHDILDTYANDLGDDYTWNDDEWIKELQEEGIDTSWYKGEGIYTDGVLVYQHGDMSLTDDVMLYRIEEMELLPEGYTMEQSITGYWRLLDSEGNYIHDDPACDDVYDEGSAIALFNEIIKNP